ncbi:MAG: hypothetical protein RRZ64_08875 [Rikenellaceae bacterium]
MKKINLLLMLIASFLTIMVSSCKKDDNIIITTPNEVTISILGGANVEVGKENVTRGIVVSATAPIKEDIVVDLSSNALLGEVSFSQSTLIIKAGTKTVAGNITFYADKFPKGTVEKKIAVSISTTTANIGIYVSSTEFSVKGQDPTSITVTASGAEVSTVGETPTLDVTFTLSEVVTENTSVSITLDPSSSEVFKTMYAEGFSPIEIPVGQTQYVAQFAVPKGTEGTLKLKFAITNKDILLNTSDISVSFVNK